MKKIILTVAAIFAFGYVNAQETSVPEGNGFSKGNKFVEGAFSFRSQDEDLSEATSSWAFNPTFGYFLTDKWAVGGKLNFGGEKFDNGDKSSDLGVTGFARYYFLSLGATKSFNAFGEIGLGYTSETNDPNVGSKSTDGDLNANISIGLNYFFTSHWAATFTLANILSYNNSSPEVGDNTSDLNVEVNLFNNIFAEPQFGLLYKW
ncbi:MAG: outer membrane beta-barrel protein [Bacteroidota bacterium]